MIDHKYKLIFIHIPKTGGTSIENLFNPNQRWTESIEKKRHLTAEQYKNRYPRRWSEYYKFAVVRNPWSLVVSFYHWRTRNHDFQFKDWILEGDYVPYNPFLIREGMTNLDYISDKNGNIIIDNICRTETLQEDFNTICDKIGIPRQQLPHSNKTKHKHYTEYYDDETREIVAEKYAKDIEYFGYKFGE